MPVPALSPWPQDTICPSCNAPSLNGIGAEQAYSKKQGLERRRREVRVGFPRTPDDGVGVVVVPRPQRDRRSYRHPVPGTAAVVPTRRRDHAEDLFSGASAPPLLLILLPVGRFPRSVAPPARDRRCAIRQARFHTTRFRGRATAGGVGSIGTPSRGCRRHRLPTNRGGSRGAATRQSNFHHTRARGHATAARVVGEGDGGGGGPERDEHGGGVRVGPGLAAAIGRGRQGGGVHPGVQGEPPAAAARLHLQLHADAQEARDWRRLPAASRPAGPALSLSLTHVFDLFRCCR
jgi:hypothetical protein